MNKKYPVIYLPLFYEDLEKILNYILYQLENKTAAKNLVSEIEKEIEKRTFNPINYEKYKSNKKRKSTYYRIYVKNYVIYYTFDGDKIEIRRILYGRRDISKLI